jgi:hypothetical protein
MGHEIAPGASYCAMGHPIAMEAMPFGGGGDQYGGGGYGGAPPPQPGFGAPPPQQGFGAPPQQGFGAPQQQPGGYYGDQGGYGQQQQPGGFGAPAPQQGFGAPPPQQGFGGAPMQQPGGYDQGQGGFGQHGSQPAFPSPAFGAPAPQQAPGFGSAPGFGAPAPAPAPAGAPAAAQAPPLPPAIPDNLPPQALRGFLVSYQSNATGDFWPLHGGRKTVGRANSGESVDIALSDATISSRHAAVIVDGASGVITVEDTGSTNGTFVNEEHVGFNGRRDLRDGDRVRFGGYTVIAKIVTR